MSTKKILTGNKTAAYAVKNCDVQVVSAYPITPQSSVVETISDFVSKGDMKSEFVPVESEHSAITVCISASITGARVFTATSSNGLALMHEQLHWAAGARVPIVMCCVNRGMAAPWTILNDQQDSISQRDTGWIQLYVENNQEIFDTVIMAYKLAEQMSIPVMVCYDGFILSHRSMPVTIESKTKIEKFLPKYKSEFNLTKNNALNLLPLVLPDKRKFGNKTYKSYIDFRYELQKDLEKSLKIIPKINSDFKKHFNRSYNNGLFKTYKCKSAEHFIVTMGSLGSEAVEAVNVLRSEKIKCGLINVKSYRPFPGKEIVKTLKKAKTITIFEKNISYGMEGALSGDLKASFYNFHTGTRPYFKSIVCGLGGRDVNYLEIVNETKTNIKNKNKSGNTIWLGCDK